MGKLIVVANRLPISVKTEGEEFEFIPSSGGLATAMSSLNRPHEWIGWPGIAREDLSEEQTVQLDERLRGEGCHGVMLSRQEVEDFYFGFSNQTIWPLFHYFPLYTTYRDEFWDAYRHVNRLYFEKVVQLAEPDDVVWVHDYQLMLLPRMLRAALPEVAIGFFLHIPFPSFELFRLLPWRLELLDGLLGADLVGFHTYDYVRHFFSAASRLLGAEQVLGELNAHDRVVKVDAFPLGIDYDKYHDAPLSPAVQQELQKFQDRLRGRRVILSVERLDYTKGILERLEAFDRFLSEYPQYHEQVSLVMVTVPSRPGVGDYQVLKEQLDGLVGKINGAHGTIGWTPVQYLFTSVRFEELAALYHLADVALVTPLRDGMNLVAKEFIAAKRDRPGTLVLSEMAGAASELGEALVVNANDTKAIVQAIRAALEMPAEQQQARNRSMQQRLRRYNVFRWADDFLESVEAIKSTQKTLARRRLSASLRDDLMAEYRQARRRLFFLDYDGTLRGFVESPARAQPEPELLELLAALAGKPGNEIVIISGRDRETLEAWLGDLPVSLIGEHGAWIRERGGGWQLIEPLKNDWKESIRPILKLYADRTPGAQVEEKDYSLVWHCRRANREMAYVRMHELKDAISRLVANIGVGVYEGNKVLEVKHQGVNKGRAAALWAEKDDWDFILAAGDDFTDEDMFAALPARARTFKVGYQPSQAMFHLDSVDEVRRLLRQFVEQG